MRPCFERKNKNIYVFTFFKKVKLNNCFPKSHKRYMYIK